MSEQVMVIGGSGHAKVIGVPHRIVYHNASVQLSMSGRSA